MKKQFLNIIFSGLLLLPFTSTKADTVVDGQSTEGKDFWVTFMQADQDDNNELKLELSISSRENCQATIENPFTGYTETVDIVAGEMKPITLYEGNVLTNNARNAMSTSGKVCYAVNSEKVDTCALHITATANIALFATNYKKATFDATNVLPTVSLLDEYIIQTYTPSDHGGTGSTQGSHFAVIAAEDNTIIDYCPSVETTAIAAAKSRVDWDPEAATAEEKALANYQFGRDTLHSPVLMKGQVWYVWTGKKDGEPGDLSGTYVRAQGGKKIAVFQGCPHTNIPYQKKERDHIFSQAMPTRYWGNTFALTASKERKIDIVRVMALNDETEVRINGELVHTIKFDTDKKHYWEFEIGANAKTIDGYSGNANKNNSCIVTTSCPCAVHLFLVSRKYDDVTNGDPAMLWINPIEQQIDQVTFATYASSNGTTYHYTNVVTDKPALMTLDDISIEEQFTPVSGSSTYYYAQVSLGNEAKSHTLKSNGSNFIAHVYGFTENESYGYSAGGATKPLTQYITINGEIFSPDKENTLCGEDTIKFACHPDYVFNKIKWNFGDGVSQEFTYEQVQGADSVVPHYYQTSGVYQAYVLIYRESSNVCVGQNAVDSIPITVTIGKYVFEIMDVDVPCPEDGEQRIGKIYYSNAGKVDLHGDNVSITFNDAAKKAGFKDEDLTITDSYFQILIPDTAKTNTVYGIDLKITSDCGGADTTLTFMLKFDKDVITQRYNNVLGLLKEPFEGKTLSNFQWYSTKDSLAIPGQVSANLNFEDVPYGGDTTTLYYVCFTINAGKPDSVRTCACGTTFKTNSDQKSFDNPDSLSISATYTINGDRVFVNADWGDKTDIDCYAQWINASGRVYEEKKFTIPNGGCTIPAPKAQNELYLLRVVTGKKSRSFKFIINN